jgi:hypothetical protein
MTLAAFQNVQPLDPLPCARAAAASAIVVNAAAVMTLTTFMASLPHK